MAAAHPLGCARTVDILNAAPEPVRHKIKVNVDKSDLFCCAEGKWFMYRISSACNICLSYWNIDDLQELVRK
jgi:hypothetical protein